MILIYIVLGGLGLLTSYLFFRLRHTLTDTDLMEWLEEMQRDIDVLKEDLNFYVAERGEIIEEALSKLNNRLTTRSRREGKSINTGETFKKGGLMKAEDLRRHGFIK